MGSPTVLYHFWRSSASWRVRWALAIKGVAYESVHVNLTESAQLSEAHRARNPIGHLPVLDIDGHRFAESVAIIEYLEETRPTPALLPRDPVDRARVRQLVELVNSGIQPLQNLIVLKTHSGEPAQQREWARMFNARGLAAYEALVKQFDALRGAPGRFSYGDTLTLADLCLVAQVYGARRFGADISALERVVAIDAAASATEHANAARPESQADAPKS